MLVFLALGLGALGGATYALTVHLRQSARTSAIRSALANRDLPLAQRLLDEHLRDREDDAEMHFLAAQTARRLDDFPAADRHLERYRVLGGDREALELERVLRRSQSGDLAGSSGALAFCTEHPENAAVPMMIEALTRGTIAANRPELAVTATDVWLKRNPPPGEKAYAQYLRGRGFELQAMIPDALALYREALALNPRLHEATFALAEVLASESPTEALPLYDRLREEGYRPTEVALGTARCRRQLGEPDRAAALVAPLVAEQPVNVAVLVEAAKIDLDRNNPAEAERHLKAAIGIAPKHRDANVQLARCLRDLGRDAEARVQLEVVRKIDEELDRKAP
jgi:tetratricopeptide (TPR) repeat protein